MGTYKRGDVWWVRYAGPDGEIVRESAKTGDQRVAKRYEATRRAEVDAGTWKPQSGGRALSVAVYAETWLQRQRDRKLKTIDDIETRMRLHVLPRIGDRLLDSVKPRDVISFVRDVTASGLAPRSVHHVYDVLRSMMRDAQIDELVVASPCVLPPGTLPKKRDKDPAWRSQAIFTREEVEALISDDRLPLDRRTFYALIFLGGMRHGEAAGRQWREYDTRATPLGRLVIATQYDGEELKTENPREMPVHPTLAAMLAEWKLHGFGMFFGRSPKPDDWIVPSRRGTYRRVRHTYRRLNEDLERLGYRGRRTHDLRRTFVSLARADGADRDVLKACTHGPSGDIIDMYTTYPWATLCGAVGKLQIRRRGGQVYSLEHIDPTENENPAISHGVSGRSGRDSKPRR